MSTTTTNFKFVKPEKTDPADITAINSNWDAIDGELKSQNDNLEELNTLAPKTLKYLSGTMTTADDTPTYWNSLGSGIKYFESAILQNQPENYGMVFNMKDGFNVQQMFVGNTGKVWTRTGSKSSTSWKNNGWVQLALETDLTTLASKHNVASYVSFEQIGITIGEETIEDIVNKLPSNSTLYVSISDANASIYPMTYGTLMVRKKNTGRVNFDFYQKASTGRWYGVYDDTASTPWIGWKKIYNEANKPTPDEIGAASLSDHNMKSYISLDQIGLTDDDFSETNALANFILLHNAVSSRSECFLYLESTNKLALSIHEKIGTDVGDIVNSNFNVITRKLNANITTIEVVPVYYNGGTYPLPGFKYGCSLRYTAGSIEYLSPFSIIQHPAGFISNADKPNGSYSGNSSTTERTINTGGVGDTLMIRSSYGMAIVTPSGAIVKSTTNVTALTSSMCSYNDGILTIATDDSHINNNKFTYHYQCL